MTGNYLNKLLNINAKHALYREDGKWYHNLKEFPGALFDRNGYVIFNNKESYYSYPGLQIRKDLHIANGIRNLDNYKEFSDAEKQLIEGIQLTSAFVHSNTEETVRILREIDIILRNRHLADRVKDLYVNTCQLCLIQLKINENRFYSEVHHIIPLGKPHNGKDNLENMICVCPNCHILLDLKAIKLTEASIKLAKHIISLKSTEYHNSFLKE